jgi:hypothetical protein
VAEQSRLSCTPGVSTYCPLTGRKIRWIWSVPDRTCRVSLSITHLETNAPVAPWARTTPSPAGISWFISTVKVPSPLSKAPRPSGMPTIR